MILALSGLLFAACIGGIDTEEADRSNEAVLDSLPVYPGAILIGRNTLTSGNNRHLVVEYATNDDEETVSAFYLRELPELGFQFLHSEGPTFFVFGREGDNIDVVLDFAPLVEPAEGNGEVPEEPSPPEGVILYEIRIVSD